ncbi:MAG: hypothetical protein F6K14_20115 [Symploca sp. SIO2C1]|nr:hypothetical protein [Symploca sp. SIO2C1]
MKKMTKYLRKKVKKMFKVVVAITMMLLLSLSQQIEPAEAAVLPCSPNPFKPMGLIVEGLSCEIPPNLENIDIYLVAVSNGELTAEIIPEKKDSTCKGMFDISDTVIVPCDTQGGKVEVVRLEGEGRGSLWASYIWQTSSNVEEKGKSKNTLRDFQYPVRLKAGEQ